MTETGHPKDPLHGITLKALLTALVERYEWAGLAQRVDLACFRNDPSISSSLKFLRRTAWARAKIEALWVADARKAEKNRLRNKRRAERRAIAASFADAEAADAEAVEAAEEGDAAPKATDDAAVSPAVDAADASKSEPPPHS